MRGFSFKSVLPYLVIILVGLLVFGLNFAPALYYDDWQNLVGRFYHGLTLWINPEFSRPFRETSWKLLITLFGFNPGSMLAANVAIHITTALLLYRLFIDIQPGKAHLALAFALLSLVYPADKTRMWLVITNLGWTVGCLSALLLYHYCRTGKPWMLFLVVLGYIYVYLEYEGPLGILTTWGVLLMAWYFPAFWPSPRGISWRRWFGLGLPLLLFGLYLFYRLVWVNWTGTGGFHQIKSTNLLLLLSNLWIGFQTLAWAWFEPLHALFPNLRISWLILASILLLAAWGALGWGTTLLLNRRQDWAAVSSDERRQSLLRALLTGLAGLFLAAAGYFPFITYAPPGIEFFSSRFNAYALVGAALLIVGLLDLLTWTLTHRKSQTIILFSLLVFPFIFLGAGSELVVQRQSLLLWQEYRQMWQGIFTVAPGIKEGSSVVLVITHTPCKPAAYGERPFFYSNMANWELNDAFNAFYGTQQISADFVYQGCDLPYQVRFRGEGYNNPPSYDGINPYKQVLVLAYDRTSHQVQVVKDLTALARSNPVEYQPQSRITLAPLSGNLRYLLQP
jgi:hypothetical protein